MTNNMRWTGLFATFLIVIIIPLYAWLEPERQENLVVEYRIESVVSAADLYAEDCAVCHGASGEGIADTPAINSDAVRSMSESDLLKVISRGRYNTQMAAWAIEEGGVLSNSQIDDLVALIQYGNWDYVEERVAELGLTPPEVIEFEVTEDVQALLAAIPEGETLAEGLMVYEENCAACHDGDGSGTLIAPAIDSPDLRARSRVEIVDIINNGVPGTRMSSWENMLTSEQLEAVVDLIYNWPLLVEAGIEFPDTALDTFPSTPEMVTDGSRLFDIACTSCHGTGASGTVMAPALNDQTFLSETPDAVIYQIIASGVTDTRMPAWGGFLTEEDIQSLVAYLRSLEVKTPSSLPPVNNP